MAIGSLKSKTIYALSWSFIEAIGFRLVQFVIGIILARLLLPEQFGLIGMLMIFMAVAQSFLDSGFGAALIQKREPTKIDICSIFYFNIVVGLVAAGILCLAAPLIASFYNQPILTPLTRLMSLVIVINSLSLIQGTLVTKRIDFKTITKVTLVASGISGIVGISMAVAGFGVWSLAVQQIAGAGLRTVLLWVFNSWRPSLVFSFESLKEMFGFGSKLLASGLLNTIFDNIYLIVIGKMFSPTDLGYYSRAYNMQGLPSGTLSSMVVRVTFPVFSTIQDDPERLKRGMKKALTLLCLVNFPLMIGLAVVARPLVMVLLTDKWAPSIPYLQLLCMVGLTFPLQLINVNVIVAMGRSDLFLRLEIIKKALIVINIAITWRWGIMAMIIGQIVTSLASYYLNAYYNRTLLGYSIWEQIGDLFVYLIMTVIMGGMIVAIGLIPLPNPLILLITQTILGFLIYILLCRFFRLAAYMELQERVLKTIPFLRVLVT